MSNWTEVLKCKECGNLPMILPHGKKKVAISCDHGVQQIGNKFYETTEEWNRAQVDKQND